MDMELSETVSAMGDRERVLWKIDAVVRQFLASAQGEAAPCLQLPWHPTGGVELSRVSGRSFCRLLVLLGQVEGLVTRDAFATKRELFYRAKEAYGGGQGACDRAVTALCALLAEPRSALHVMATAKGTFAGPLSWDGAPPADDGTARLVPQMVGSLRGLASPARFVLVVEKDAVFQNLLDDGFLDAFRPALLLTGKGYPDLASRQLAHRLVCELGLPGFLLVDADVHGIEIAATYKFGPRKKSFESGVLAMPDLRLLGLRRSEAERDLPLAASQLLSMGPAEFNKIAALKERPDVAADDDFMAELSALSILGTKVETEALAELQTDYLTRVFLPAKLPQFLAGAGRPEAPHLWE